MEEKEVQFSLDGDVESQKNKKVNVAAWAMGIIAMLSMATNIYLLLSKGNKESTKPKTEVETCSENLKKAKAEMLQLQNEHAILMPQFKTPQGVFYEVQIGAFQNFNLYDYTNELAELRQEKTDTNNKFLIGRFAELNKALRFENDLKRLGLSGAFIVGRVNGKIVSKEEALKAQKLLKN